MDKGLLGDRIHYCTINVTTSENPFTFTIPDNNSILSDNLLNKKRIIELDKFLYEGVFLDVKDVAAQGIKSYELAPSMFKINVSNNTSQGTYNKDGTVSNMLDVAFPFHESEKFSIYVPDIGEITDFYKVYYSASEGQEGYIIGNTSSLSITVSIDYSAMKRTVANTHTSALMSEVSGAYDFANRSVNTGVQTYNWSEKFYMRFKVYIEEI